MTRHTQVRAHTWPGCCRVALEWRNLADLGWRSGSHRGSGRRSTSDTGQLCRCGRRSTVGAGPRVLVLRPESGRERRAWALRPGASAGREQSQGCAEQAHAAERLGLDVYAVTDIAGDSGYRLKARV